MMQWGQGRAEVEVSEIILSKLHAQHGAPIAAGSGGAISQPRDHDLSQNQESHA